MGLKVWFCAKSFLLPFPVTAVLRKLKQQSRESVEDKRPKLLKALREVSVSVLAGASCINLHHRNLTADIKQNTFSIFITFFPAWWLLSGASLGLSELGWVYILFYFISIKFSYYTSYTFFKTQFDQLTRWTKLAIKIVSSLVISNVFCPIFLPQTNVSNSCLL